MGEVRGIIWLVGLAGLVWVIWQWEQGRRFKVGVPAQAKVERALRPRTPEACPACRDPSHARGQHPLKGSVQSWSEVKSRRGRRKRLNTAGYACVNKDCQYYGITDGLGRSIPDIRCKRGYPRILSAWPLVGGAAFIDG